jgi:hypothetical protein
MGAIQEISLSGGRVTGLALLENNKRYYPSVK